MNTARFLLLCGAFMLCGVLFLAWLGSTPNRKIAGKPFPIFALESLVNSRDPLTIEQLIGKKWLVLLWSADSTSADAQIDQFRSLTQKHSNFGAFAVAYSTSGLIVPLLQQRASDLLQLRQYDLATYVDPTGKSAMEYAMLMPFGSFGFPTIFILDDRGQIIGARELQKNDAWSALDVELNSY